MAYDKNTNWANEEAYLNKTISSGSAGQAAWAKQQLNALNTAKAQYTQPTPAPTPTAPKQTDTSAYTNETWAKGYGDEVQKQIGNTGKTVAYSQQKADSRNATAWIPGVGEVRVSIIDGKTQDTGLPVGTIVTPDGNSQSWRITGATASGYTSEVAQGYTPNVGATRKADGNWYYSGSDNSGNSSGIPQRDSLEGLINDYYSEAQKQALLKSQYATESGVRDLQNVLTNAKPGFQTMKDQSALATAKSLDNQALRSELQGDQGGIGNAQYGSIQAAGSERLLQIDLELKNLETTTNQQIANLRAQGKFEEANLIYQNAQNKIQALIDEKNNAYNAQLDVYKLGKDDERWNKEFNQKQQGIDADNKQLAYNNALKRLELGIFSEQDAMTLGIPADQAKAYAQQINTLAQLDIEYAKKKLTASSSGSSGSGPNPYEDELPPPGPDPDPKIDLGGPYKDDGGRYIVNTNDDNGVEVKGLGKLTRTELETYVKIGIVKETIMSDGGILYTLGTGK